MWFFISQLGLVLIVSLTPILTYGCSNVLPRHLKFIRYIFYQTHTVCWSTGETVSTSLLYTEFLIQNLFGKMLQNPFPPTKSLPMGLSCIAISICRRRCSYMFTYHSKKLQKLIVHKLRGKEQTSEQGRS